MFVCKLSTPSCSEYEHFHVYLDYRKQTGNVVTRQTFDRAPRQTRPPIAHISRGDITPLTPASPSGRNLNLLSMILLGYHIRLDTLCKKHHDIISLPPICHNITLLQIEFPLDMLKPDWDIWLDGYQISYKDIWYIDESLESFFNL